MSAENTENYHRRIVELKKEIIAASKALKKETVVELAKMYLSAFDEPIRGDILQEIRTLLKKEKIKPSDIAAFLKAWKDSLGLNISDAWLYKTIPDKCKTEYKSNENLTESKQKASASMATKSEDELEVIYDLIKEKVENTKKRRSLDQHIEQVKKEVDEDGNYGCITASILEKLIEKLRKEHDKHHDKELEKKSEKRLKSACDNRHIESQAEMEALIIIAEYGSSLKNAVSGTTYPISRWDLEKNEKNCKQCGNDFVRCSKDNCNCVCHQTQKVGTTKGMKFARDSDEALKNFSNKLQDLKKLEDSYDDFCELGKIVLGNVRVSSASDKLRIISDHIRETKCLRCEDFLESHPDYFKEGK